MATRHSMTSSTSTGILWDAIKEKALAEQPANPLAVSEPRNEAHAPSAPVGARGHDQEDKPSDVGRENARPEHRPEGEPGGLRQPDVPGKHEHRELPAANEPAEP